MNVKIQILDAVDGFPSLWERSNKIYLDVDTAPVLAESNGSLTDISKIGKESIAEVNIPFSGINDFVLQRYRKIYTDTTDTISVHVTIDGQYLPFDLLTVSNVDFQGKQYNIQLKLSENHWINKLEQLTLNNLVLGTYEFSKATITGTWSGLPATSGLFFPLIQYGNLKNKNNGVSLLDFRPWIQALWLLDLAFCQIEYTFTCGFLESTFGRLLFSYILNKDYGKTPGLLEARKFTAALPIALSSTPTYADAFDPNDLHDAGYYFGTGIFDFFATIEGTVTVPFENTVLIVQTWEHSDGTKTYFNATPSGIGNQPFVIKGELKDVTINQGEWIKVSYKAVTSSGTALSMNVTDGVFYNDPLRAIPTEGDIIDLSDQVRTDSVLDYFKGIIHLIAGKIDYDPTTKTVELLTQRTADVFGDSVTGFYNATAVDLTAYQKPEEEQISINRVEENRYLRIGFKESTDPAYKEESPEDTLFSRIVDRGSIFKEDTTPDRNPYFEPTLVKDVNDLHPTFKIPVALGHALDNNQNKTSYDIGPRIGVAVNYQHLRDGNSSNFKWDVTTYTTTPTIIQRLPDDVSITHIDWNDQNLVYGSRTIDLFTIGWQWEAALRKVRKLIRFSLEGFYNRYKELDFKNLHLLRLDGRTLPARIEEKSYDDNTGEIVISVIPERASFADCADTPGTGSPPDTVLVCNNMPDITLTYDSGAGTITATADNSNINSTIDADTWEYSTNGGSSWSSYTVGTPLSASGETLFRRSLTYTDGCPNQTVVKTYTPQQECNNQGDIDLEYNEGNNSIVGTAVSNFNSTVNTDTWTVSVNGAPAVSYTPGTIITDFTTVDFVRTVTFTDICPDVVVNASFTSPANPCSNYPTIGITDIGAGLVLPALAGTSASAIAHTLIQVSQDGGTTWKNWNHLPIVKGSSLQLKATVMYCDGCQPICVEYECT